MNLYQEFIGLPQGNSPVEFTALPLSSWRRDFLAKARDGNPVLLLHDASSAMYTPGISLKNVSVQFHVTCRVTTTNGTLEDQFAVVTCDASSHELHELFIRCFAAAIEQLPVSVGTGELSARIHGLLDLFRALARPANKEITGLWAELFIINSSRNIHQALKAWHADKFERFDFSWEKGCLEVKATTKETRTHDFALEQLHAPVNGKGFVASLLLQPLAGGVGIMGLARKIDEALVNEPQLRQKLWENLADALGNEFTDKLDQAFDPSYAERNLAVFAMGDIPTIDQPVDARVTAVRFRSDLSSVKSSLGGMPTDVLNRIFS